MSYAESILTPFPDLLGGATILVLSAGEDATADRHNSKLRRPQLLMRF